MGSPICSECQSVIEKGTGEYHNKKGYHNCWLCDDCNEHADELCYAPSCWDDEEDEE